MPHVAALYRYPVKGLTPEARDAIDVLPEGRVAGDRVFGVRFADSLEPDDAWGRKAGMLVLMNTPGLARLRLRYDDALRRLRIELDGVPFADEILDAAGRARLAARLARYAASLPDNPLEGHPERLPLRIVGDGLTPRFTDAEAGGVSMHGRGSLAALAAATGSPAFDERRFRSNIAVEGLEAWQELGWAGRTVRIGAVTFEATRPMGRCLATHANPTTGRRDCDVMQTLTTAFKQERATFAISLRALNPGPIRLGDPVEPA